MAQRARSFLMTSTVMGTPIPIIVLPPIGTRRHCLTACCVEQRTGPKFGNNVIETMLPDPAFFRDAQGRGVKDFKACIARDFDADGKTDIVTGMMAEIATDPDGPYASWMRGLAVLHNESTPGSIRFADVSHRAIAGAYSDGTKYPQMHVYSIVALDFDRDGRLDLFVTGSRSPAAHLSLESKTDLLRVYRNESRPGQIRFSDVTEQAGLSFFNDERVASVFPEAPQAVPATRGRRSS